MNSCEPHLPSRGGPAGTWHTREDPNPRTLNWLLQDRDLVLCIATMHCWGRRILRNSKHHRTRKKGRKKNVIIRPWLRFWPYGLWRVFFLAVWFLTQDFGSSSYNPVISQQFYVSPSASRRGACRRALVLVLNIQLVLSIHKTDLQRELVHGHWH